MNTGIGVKITHPRYDFARLCLLNRAQDRTRHFMTLSPGQKEADVEIHLIKKTPNLEYRSLKILHHFHLVDLPVETNQAISLSIRTRYDGTRKARIDIMYKDQLLDSTELIVRSDRIFPWIIPLLISLLIIALAAGGTLAFRNSQKQKKIQPIEVSAQFSRTTLPVPHSSVNDETEEAKIDKAEADASPEPDRQQAITPDFAEYYTIYFTPNQTYITEESAAVLRSLANKLQQTEQVHISAEGHTADYGNFEEQLEISRLRVAHTMEFLAEQGWNPTDKAEIDWYGPAFPVTQERSRQHENRRVEIRIIQTEDD